MARDKSSITPEWQYVAVMILLGFFLLVSVCAAVWPTVKELLDSDGEAHVVQRCVTTLGIFGAVLFGAGMFSMVLESTRDVTKANAQAIERICDAVEELSQIAKEVHPRVGAVPPAPPASGRGTAP